MRNAAQSSFFAALADRSTVRRALKVSAIVGTLLTLLNHGDHIWLGIFPPLWKIVLTYLVPYSVSSYSTAALKAELCKAAAPKDANTDP